MTNKLSTELDAMADMGIPIIRICEGGGPEDPVKSVVVTISKLHKDLAEREAELSRWRKSFDGHVYVSTEKYSHLINLLSWANDELACPGQDAVGAFEFGHYCPSCDSSVDRNMELRRAIRLVLSGDTV